MKARLAGALLLCAASAAFAARTADEVLRTLSEQAAASQVFLVNIEGDTRFRAVESRGGRPLLPGGVLLFSYNIADTYDGVRGFCSSILEYYSENGEPAPYIAVDHEGGAVNRLRGIVAALPSEEDVAERFTLEEAASLYTEQARALRGLGITVNLAPVAEPRLPFNSAFLGDRSFGTRGDAIAYSKVCIHAYEGEGVAAFVKHFPGNGASDPHAAESTVDLPRGDIARDAVEPFAGVLAARPSGVIMSHTRFPAYDDKSATLSEVWIRGVLRGELGYEGLAVSDDVYMGAVAAESPENVAIRALEAGVDVIMISEKRFKPFLDAFLARAKEDPSFRARLEDAERRVISFKLEKGIIN